MSFIFTKQELIQAAKESNLSSLPSIIIISEEPDEKLEEEISNTILYSTSRYKSDYTVLDEKAAMLFSEGKLKNKEVFFNLNENLLKFNKFRYSTFANNMIITNNLHLKNSGEMTDNDIYEHENYEPLISQKDNEEIFLYERQYYQRINDKFEDTLSELEKQLRYEAKANSNPKTLGKELFNRLMISNYSTIKILDKDGELISYDSLEVLNLLKDKAKKNFNSDLLDLIFDIEEYKDSLATGMIEKIVLVDKPSYSSSENIYSDSVEETLICGAKFIVENDKVFLIHNNNKYDLNQDINLFIGNKPLVLKNFPLFEEFNGYEGTGYLFDDESNPFEMIIDPTNNIIQIKIADEDLFNEIIESYNEKVFNEEDSMPLFKRNNQAKLNNKLIKAIELNQKKDILKKKVINTTPKTTPKR